MLKAADFDAFNNITDDEGGCSVRFYGDAMWPGAGPGNRNFSCRRQYQAMLAALDRNIGRVVDALTAKGLWSDTLMTFFSDNGGCVELSENAGNNFPLRGGKYSPFEGGIRVTAFLSGGYLPAAARGTTSHELVHVADYYVTLCVRAGLPLAECTADPLAAAGEPPRAAHAPHARCTHRMRAARTSLHAPRSRLARPCAYSHAIVRAFSLLQRACHRSTASTSGPPSCSAPGRRRAARSPWTRRC